MIGAAKRIWAFPYTLVGLIIGYVAVLFGGSVSRISGCWEFHGKLIRWLLRKVPIKGGALALTLGHTIFGQSQEALDLTRDHEHVHVRQYENWGVFFLPAYGMASIIAWLKGDRFYRDNYFEKEAYSVAGTNGIDGKNSDSAK